MGLHANCTRVFLPYCDSSSFTSWRAQPWPVPGGGQLVFKGRGNLETTLDVLASRFNLGMARRVVVSGGSAGALTTYLHVDRIAERIRALAPGSAAQHVVGAPNAGYFIDATPYTPPTSVAVGSSDYPPGSNYSSQIEYGMAMFNSTPSLLSDCKAAQISGEEWRCFLAPVAFPFIKQPIFALQSRFDEYQLMANFRLPCEQGQSFAPPYKPNRCSSPSNRSAIDAFGREFIRQFAPVLASPSTGCFLTSCIQHSVSALLRNVTTATAFDSWLNAGEVGKDFGYKFVDRCGSSGDGSTPCNPGPRCAPY